MNAKWNPHKDNVAKSISLGFLRNIHKHEQTLFRPKKGISAADKDIPEFWVWLNIFLQKENHQQEIQEKDPINKDSIGSVEWVDFST